MAGNLSLTELKHEVAAGRIDTVIVAMVDMQGRLVGKRFHAEHFVDGLGGIDGQPETGTAGETHGCNYLLTVDIDMQPVPGYAAASWEKGYGDFALRPDFSTLRWVPWLPGSALVVCDVVDGEKTHHHHADVPHSPRAMLKRQIARLQDQGHQPMMASELEFYLFDETYSSAAAKGFRNLATASDYIEDYGILPTTKEEGVMRLVRSGLHGAGIRVESSKGEWGPGQEEINVRYADALTTADEHVILKNGIKEIAHLKGKAVTFMAKPAYDLAGSSCHVHLSLWSPQGAPQFYDASAEHGMAALMGSFMAGLLAHAREITWFLAPYVNSYKRFQVGTFAPTKAIWSHDNRTAGFRVVGAGSSSVRVECRIGGADLNPHLAFAALLAAGISGIEQELELEPATTGNAYAGKRLREIPKTLREAIATMQRSKMLERSFGAEVIAHYVHTAEWEQFEYDRRVTDWELQRGFERY